ncbi:hypothetical protein SALBM311S_09839 [Streptomyces alboniger]
MQTLVRAARLMLLRTLRRVGGIVLTAGIVLRAIQSLVPVGIALTMSALIQPLCLTLTPPAGRRRQRR